jgi:hypothetical protein
MGTFAARRYSDAENLKWDAERAGKVAKLALKAHPHVPRRACGYALANKHEGASSAPWASQSPVRFKDFWR